MERMGSTLSLQHHDNPELSFRRDLLLTIQVALLGEVAQLVRGITVGWNTKEIQLRAIIDGPISEGDKESMEYVASEIMASFPDHQIKVETVRSDAPAPLEPHNLKAWVYSRKER